MYSTGAVRDRCHVFSPPPLWSIMRDITVCTVRALTAVALECTWGAYADPWSYAKLWYYPWGPQRLYPMTHSEPPNKYRPPRRRQHISHPLPYSSTNSTSPLWPSDQGTECTPDQILPAGVSHLSLVQFQLRVSYCSVNHKTRYALHGTYGFNI